MFLFIKTYAVMQLFFSTAFALPTYHSSLENLSDQLNHAYFAPTYSATNALYFTNEDNLVIPVLNAARPSARAFVVVAEEKRWIQYDPKAVLFNGNLVYRNSSDPILRIINLLPDKNNDSKTNRNHNPADVISNGITIHSYNVAGDNSVNKMEYINTTDDTTNKKYPTFWGGDISFWKNDSSYGYTARGLGQDIFKDNDTKIIEKLVTPWLLLYTNQYRKAHGLDTLQYDQCLLKAAVYQTNYLFNESKINHQFKLNHYQDSGSQWFTGASPSDRALTAGCKKYCGENALYTNILPIPEKDKNNLHQLNLAAQKIARNMVYDQWHHSKGHRENMLNKGFTILGVSVAIGKHYTNDYYINDKGEKALIGDSNTVSWIAFGIQVMAY